MPGRWASRSRPTPSTPTWRSSGGSSGRSPAPGSRRLAVRASGARALRGGPARRPCHDRPTHEGRLLRDPRVRLLAWSGGSTLVVLIALGLALHIAVATSLANETVT